MRARPGSFDIFATGARTIHIANKIEIRAASAKLTARRTLPSHGYEYITQYMWNSFGSLFAFALLYSNEQDKVIL